MDLFSYVRRHAKAVLFSVTICVLSGIALMLNMPISLFPDITFPRIVILADNGEEPAERMMVEVTKPLEEVASSIPGVRIVRSITGRGSTEISIGLEWGSNVLQTLQLLQGRISNIRNVLPPNASVPGGTNERLRFSDPWIQLNLGQTEHGGTPGYRAVSDPAGTNESEGRRKSRDYRRRHP